jgi:kexin
VGGRGGVRAGLDYRHPDFSGTYCAECSWDYNLNRAEPLPMLVDDVHGTRCAGQIAAAPNTACGVGVAHGARVSGLRILSAAVTDSMEADALNFRWNENHIYSNSWGPYDNGYAAHTHTYTHT